MKDKSSFLFFCFDGFIVANNILMSVNYKTPDQNNPDNEAWMQPHSILSSHGWAVGLSYLDTITGDTLITRYQVSKADRPQGSLRVYKMYSETGTTMSWYLVSDMIFLYKTFRDHSTAETKDVNIWGGDTDHSNWLNEPLTPPLRMGTIWTMSSFSSFNL